MLSPGQVIDRKYRIVRIVGQGGMGSVYEGVNERIGRRVAIKVLHPEFAWMSEIVQRFEREARAAAEIGSDHIVDVLDLGELPDGERYLVMEYLEGRSLAELMDERKIMPPAEITPIIVQVLRALDRAHAAGIIHRDLKPDNVFMAETPHGVVVKLLDFGVSKFAHAEGQNTQAGYLVGTPAYMAPEQARGEAPVDIRADLHSVGVMLYQAVSGDMPRIADNPHALLFKVAMEPHQPLRSIAPHIDARFAAIVEKALAEKPEDRFESAISFEEELQVWLGRVVSSPTLGPRVSRISLVPPSTMGALVGSSNGPSDAPGSIAPPAPSEMIPSAQRDRSRALVGLGAAALAALAFVAIPRVLARVHATSTPAMTAMSVMSVTNPLVVAGDSATTSDKPNDASPNAPTTAQTDPAVPSAGGVTPPSQPSGSTADEVATGAAAPSVSARAEVEREGRVGLSHRRAAKHPVHAADRPAAASSAAKAATAEPAAPPLPAALEADPQVSPAGGKMRAKL